jgi:TM2 domain-containing membrane protein YozV
MPAPGATYGAVVKPPKDKIAAGVLGILLGGLGIHKFYLGYTSAGLVMLLGTILGWVFSCFVVPLVLPIVFGIIGLIEGIIYLTKSDEEFQASYVNTAREWF